jgi:hypothetical protein
LISFSFRKVICI